jgi:hypothetical protein
MLNEQPSNFPAVILDVVSRVESEQMSCMAYNDGGDYSDSYGDASYGDYGDADGDPDPTET